MGFYVDILEPDADLNKAMDTIGRQVGGLYAEAWNTFKKKYYDDNPFDLHINMFASLWFGKTLKIFVVYDDDTQESIGFLVGVIFRPMPYDATVFQVHEWYVKPSVANAEQALIDYVVSSIRILGCDELWIQSYDGRTIALGRTWKPGGTFTINRYTRVK